MTTIILLLSTLFQIPSYYPSIIYTATITMSTRRTRTQRARITCQHCGVTGHSSTICPRSTYSPDLPAATCPACIRTVSTLADGTLSMPSMAMQPTYHSDCPTSYPAPSYPAPSYPAHSYPAPSYPVLSYPAPSCSTPCTSGSTPSHPTSSTPCHTSYYF